VGAQGNSTSTVYVGISVPKVLIPTHLKLLETTSFRTGLEKTQTAHTEVAEVDGLEVKYPWTNERDQQGQHNSCHRDIEA